MKAMVLEKAGKSLQLRDMALPTPGPSELLVRVRACAVCRTDLHVVDGELPHPRLPLVPGHEVVGVVEEIGAEVTAAKRGDRVGIAWLGWTCGRCRECLAGRENLCENAEFTGYTRNGGYAELTLAHENYVFPVPAEYDDVTAAPLLCRGSSATARTATRERANESGSTVSGGRTPPLPSRSARWLRGVRLHPFGGPG